MFQELTAVQVPERATWQRRFVPDGAAGVRRTLAIMRQMVEGNTTNPPTGKRNPYVRAKALSIVGFVGSKNWEGEVKKLQAFCRDRVLYRKDIVGVETLQTPEYTLQMMQGDCDDKTILFCALAESIGHETRFRAVGNEKDRFSHVLPQVLIQRRGQRSKSWVDVELTAKLPFGFFPPTVTDMFL